MATTRVGEETCKTCHEDMPSKGFYKTYEDSPHFVTTMDAKKGPEWHGCEACHGPGKAHVEGSGDKTKIFRFETASAHEINARCLDCHAGGPQHMNALNSEHEKNGVSCISCHSPHHPKESDFLLVKSQPELCYSCHLQQKAQFDMPFHHRVNEGLIQCSDCHNVHGTAGPKPGADFVHAGCHLLQVPHRQAGTVRFRAPAREDRWMPVLPCDARGAKSHMMKVSNVNLLCLQCHTTSSFSGAPGAASAVSSRCLVTAVTAADSSTHENRI